MKLSRYTSTTTGTGSIPSDNTGNNSRVCVFIWTNVSGGGACAQSAISFWITGGIIRLQQLENSSSSLIIRGPPPPYSSLSYHLSHRISYRRHVRHVSWPTGYVVTSYHALLPIKQGPVSGSGLSKVRLGP